MSAIPGLKKKLKSVRATGKLSKAMKTVSAAKLSRLTALFRNYSLYADEYRSLLGSRKLDSDGECADTVIVLGSNRGFCGGFNNDILQFLRDDILAKKTCAHLIVCGTEISKILSENAFGADKVFAFDDIPTYAQAGILHDYICALSAGVADYRVTFVRPLYKNTMTQIPTSETLVFNASDEGTDLGEVLLFPDEKTVKKTVMEKGLRAILYGMLLETATGAQASTLMTMRSAYDTATEYGEELEGEIHRQRQRDVTADVIETASDGAIKEKEM